MSTKTLDRLINSQIHRWEKEKKARERRDESLQRRSPIITISRQVGSGGGEIGALTAKKLKYPFLDRAIVESIAERASIRQTAVETLDERARGMMEEYLRAVMKMDDLSRSEYLRQLTEVLVVAAQHGRVVILGRGAGFLLRSFPLLRVRIVCPPKIRAERIALKNSMTMREAEEMVEVIDKERALFIRNNFFMDISDATNYDLIINSEMISASHASDAIVRMFRMLYLQDRDKER
ncbi:MAG: cytidylate kinase-like family protein [Candidatus Eremiobacteraeota bacterium]|nr:cytidylate kinase-like family protein [Candidatus Eremiobacteraeota bacterium]